LESSKTNQRRKGKKRKKIHIWKKNARFQKGAMNKDFPGSQSNEKW